MEENWQTYIQSDEFQTFHAVVELLLSLPPMSQLAERRADFEMLVHLLHRLGVALNVEHVSKNYRAHYSPDVQLSGYLYSTLLTAFTLLPTYVLNGQEFYVSDTVLDQCQSLQDVFLETCKELKRQYENLQPYSIGQIRNDVKRSLVYFDRSWCRFEMPALEEIEAIHRQACRPLIEAIEVEKTLSEYEGSKSTSKRNSMIQVGANRVRLDVQRNRLLEKICELNKLANLDGKGRSDMDLTCVIEAEKLVAKPMCMRLSRGSGHDASREDGSLGALPQQQQKQQQQPPQQQLPLPLRNQQQQQDQLPQQQHKCCGGACASPVLLRISRTLLRTFERLRRVLRRYGRCLYQLNSHLANNPDLVRALELFESAWETGSRYLVQAGPRKLALVAYDVITSIKEPGFHASLVSLDPGFLVATLPRALLLHEMLRVARADAAGQERSTGQGASAAAVKKALKAPEPQLVGANPLPRPALCGKPVVPLPVSAMQRSPLAKAFLPADSAASYDEAVALLGRVSEARVARLREHLLAPVGSTLTTPAARSPAGAALQSPLLQSPSAARGAPGTGGRRQTGNGRPPGTGRCSTGRCSTGRQGERPPPTPCPPRMAVPNSSRPTTSKVDLPGPVPVRLTSPAVAAGADAPLKEESDLEDDDEDDIFCLDLASLREVEADLEAAVATVPQASLPVTSEEAPSSEVLTTAASEDEEKQVVALVSQLALRLQREKAQEWNELIQVVIQGLLLARGPTPSGHGKLSSSALQAGAEEMS
eukprot:TRINITY_DN22473_c0_g1_i1.p1 TRINITY_DN22473_c0_g1~~TRINITY_DN22473_c0_g1_i1.p1  ORF type:complete len:888 (+),score=174.67 TRINITY_DN22473_c0_g1_i1:373-2664(+)